jgi:glycosyltransferase involved in cell wall biosynthesis
MCGTPVVCSKTGGMQDQVLDPETGEEFGFCIKPAARSLIGSQQTPWVWSDHIKIEDATDAIQAIYDEFLKGNDAHKHKWAGERARESMLRRFDLETVCKTWEQELIRTIEDWRAKQQNKEYRCLEIAA